MLNIILFGAPGCGKGTQAAMIKEKYNINHISTGEVIRGEIARGTELGKSMQNYIEAGQLAPDSIVIGMIRNYMTEHKDAAGNIFDGFPRTTAQAEAFDEILKEDGESVSVMIYMDVPEEELVQRMDEFDVLYPGHNLLEYPAQAVADMLSLCKQVMADKDCHDDVDEVWPGGAPAKLKVVGLVAIAYTDERIG